MNQTEAVRIYEAMKQTTQWRDLLDDLVKAAVRYARLRVDWALTPADQRNAIDQSRRLAHNAFIDCCDILSRNMARVGESDDWRALLGHDRKVIGDFACHLHCLIGLGA